MPWNELTYYVPKQAAFLIAMRFGLFFNRVPGSPRE